MILDLNKCFPEGADGQRRPLPKQSEVLKKILSPSGPKYVAYVGGIGSGKTLIGCIAMLTMAVLYPADYLICRQFFPELKVTTYKTFLELCPPELIVENRIADMHVVIRGAGGKLSNIYFRPLESPDKFRSMNLSGFLIDEANQVSEDAFLLLQGRLRGPGLRKGLIVSNPNGHDWLFRWFFKKDHLKSEEAKKAYHLIHAPSTENIHLPDGYIQSMMESWSEDRIKREIYGSFDAFQGMVYHEFRRDTHVIKPFRIPENWERHIRIDHGYRNPCSVGFYAISPEGEVIRYDYLYVREHLIHEVVDLINKKAKGQKFSTAKIDPSVKARRAATGASDYDEYLKHWPQALPPLQTARNDVQVGIDRCKSYLKVNPKTGKPLFYVFDTDEPFLEEITTYRYQELRPNQAGLKNEKEQPVKNDDHAMDEWRYMIVDCPEPYKIEITELERKKKYSAIELALQNELKTICEPKQKDPFGF